jgi:hypothetical protein
MYLTLSAYPIGDYSMNPYTEYGYDTRREYLECIADDMGIDLEIVLMMADLLGPNEDFDGLITALDDIAETL